MITRKLLAAACAATFASGAYAVSPYDTPYGVQWNFITGSTSTGNGEDNAGEVYASPDGSAWVTNGHSGNGGGLSPWGDAKSGGHFDSGFGHVAGSGTLLYGTSLPSIMDYSGENQSYMRANSGMQGTSFIAGWSPNSSSAVWSNQTPSQSSGPNGSPMFVRVAPEVNDPATDLDLKKNVPLMTTGRLEGMAYSQTADIAWFAGGYQSGDVVTSGDGAIGSSTNYSPYIGRYDASTETVIGPAKQGTSDGRTHYNDLSVDEANNRVYGSGYALVQGSAVPSYIDFTGDGVPEITYNTGTSNQTKGFLAVFNATTMAYVDSLGWESSEGNDQIRDNIATPDGGVIAVGRTNGNLKAGAANPSLGNEDVYIAKYDSNLNLVWDWQAESAERDVAYSVDTDTDGNVYVGVQAFGSDTSGNDDARVLKFDASGNLVWSRTIDNGGSQDSIVGGSASVYDKTRIYVSTEHNATSGPTWDNIYSYNGNNDDGVYDNDEILLQKLVPGDFNNDGVVDAADISLAETAIGSGLTGVDTYDFDGDGDSTSADITFWKFQILDMLLPGDTDGDGDVDDADLGVAFANYTGPLAPNTGGKTAADGDVDGDGDVDDADLGAAFAAYTGPISPASVPEPTSLALIGLGGLALIRRRRA